MAKPLLDDAQLGQAGQTSSRQPGGSRGNLLGDRKPLRRLAGGIMSASARRTIWFVPVRMLLVAVLGLLTLWESGRC